MKSAIFWNITVCGPLKVNQCFRGTFHLHLQGQRISQTRNQCERGCMQMLAYSLTLKMEVICSSKTLVNFQWTTWCYIVSQDSVVSIATGYGLDDRGVRVQVSVGSRNFSSPHRPDRLWGSPYLLFIGYWGSFPRGKAAGA
jgi:hypothetical protein